jgi:hypothetical protein
MRTRTILMFVAVALIGVGVPAALAERDEDEHGRGHGRRVAVIQNYGVSPFLYGGYSYIPLKSTADFLGAALLWDSLHNRATVTYNGRELGLVIGSTTAYYGGRVVSLPAPPMMVREQVVVPAVVLDRYLGVPVEWDDQDDRVLIQGRPGWGYYPVLREPPVEVIRVGHGRPPPWAPAHGRRRKEAAYYAYAPAPFVYSGVTYIPLRDATSLIGAALLWDDLENRALITYNGREIGLAIGSPSVFYGGQTVVLGAPPVLLGSTVYVPEEFCVRYLDMPIRHSTGLVKMKSPKGWHDFRLSSRPPGRVVGKVRREHLIAPGKPVWSGPKPRNRERTEKPRGYEKQRGEEHQDRIAGEGRSRGKHNGSGKGKGGED